MIATRSGHVRVHDHCCPACNTMLDTLAPMDDEPAVAQPTPGDMTLCVECGARLLFDRDLNVRMALDVELESLRRQDPEGHRRLIAMSYKLGRDARKRGRRAGYDARPGR